MGYEIVNTETGETLDGFYDEYEAEIIWNNLSNELKAVCEINYIDDEEY
jgi:hypothetical protein